MEGLPDHKSRRSEDQTQPQRLDILSGLDEALHWLRVTRVQIERFVESFVSAAESDEKDFLVAVADGHFLLNAAAQAEKALNRIGRELSSNRVLQLRSLRNVHEHWEQHKGSFASPQFPKTRAGRVFAKAFPDAIPWNFKFDATGTWISTLRLEDLWSELLDVQADLEDARAALADEVGIALPRHRVDTAQPFPRRESKVLGFAMVTQNIRIDFDDPAEVINESAS